MSVPIVRILVDAIEPETEDILTLVSNEPLNTILHSALALSTTIPICVQIFVGIGFIPELKSCSAPWSFN